MISGRQLLTDLQRVVKGLEKDLREQVETLPDVGSPLRGEYDRAIRNRRTAATWTSWRDDRVSMAAVAWALGTVFVRFCEDNLLLPTPFLTGPTLERMALAEDAQGAYFQANPSHTDRDWILAGFEAIGSTQAGRLLFDRSHNPAYQIPISHDAAKELIAFWRRRGEEGSLVHDFTDESWDTRFLGDLYQDLSEYAKKTYALLQTPIFVEEFILDRTMRPALDEFGLEGFRMIDPACGSGHFLLGAFRWLMNAWEEQAPTKDVYEGARLALESIHGVDINPHAVAIARFRLVLAAMRACEIPNLAKTEGLALPIQIAVGDSLLKGRQTHLFHEADPDAVILYETEDVHEFPEILREGKYHLVVGNPPYITVKDPVVNQAYRDLYQTCSGQYALSVPFGERFFGLARRMVDSNGTGAGFVGQITANSFMKREFGKKFIENFLAHKVDLIEVIDTSGAYIPGHGIPTLIMIGRNRDRGRLPTVRTVMGVRGEPSQPSDPASGLVWRAILQQIDQPGSESDWVSVADVERSRLATHPWSLAGGGAEDLRRLVEEAGREASRWMNPPVGRAIRAGADEAYLRPRPMPSQPFQLLELLRPIVLGDIVRDWSVGSTGCIWYPYGSRDQLYLLKVELWPWRTILAERRTFHGNMVDAGLNWWEYMQHTASAYEVPMSIVFAFVATHNHFVLDRGGKVFNRSAPVIKLPEGATEDDHLRLLGLLNSSTACFWLKQVSYPKGGDPIGDEGARVSAEAWSDRYEFTGTKLEQFPVPDRTPLELARLLDKLAQDLSDTSPEAVCRAAPPTRQPLTEAKERWHSIRHRMIAFQEELDWECYGLYGILDEDVCASPNSVPDLNLGERAFEIVLARKMASGKVETQWFARHGSTPVTEVPYHWPDAYRRIVERRIELIESNRYLALIERPECKRR